MRVSAEHKFKEHACTDRPVRVGKDSHTGLFYVSVDGFGCSKMYRSAHDAVRGMLADHACFNIKITDEAAE